MRDVVCDRYTNNTDAEIMSAEMKAHHRSPDRASDICSLLTAYRLMDIMYKLDHPGDATSGPTHEHLQVDFSTIKVESYPFLCHIVLIVLLGLRDIQ